MHPKRILVQLVLLMALSSLISGEVGGQCLLANPSFEIQGEGGVTFAGWNQFGAVGSVTEARHGNLAARVSGPDGGGWNMSGYWQPLDTEPGERWEITGQVNHPEENPLTGACAALVNVEWRDAGDNLIDYDTFTVADVSSPPDEYLAFSVTSSPAPAGAATVRILVGVLQSPDDPSPDVHYDQITMYSTTPPVIDEMQWVDFPGGRIMEFAGRTWRVKGPGYYGPGPSNYCHLPECIWIDGEDRLHLTITYHNYSWHSTEIVLEEALGYGDYVFTLVGAVDQLDIHAILGLFLWQYGPCWDTSNLWWNPYNEIDVELGRWGDPGHEIAQFVVQPYDWWGNISRFDAVFGGEELSSYAFNWLPDGVEFRSWRGGPGDETPENMIHQWSYSGPHIPRPEQPRVHMNLWQFNGPPATDQEVIVDHFTFLPMDGAVAVPDQPEAAPTFSPIVRLQPPSPNPFNPATTIRYTLEREGVVRIAVHDVSGALVRTLLHGLVLAGDGQVVWDGRDDGGERLPSGVYLCTLSAGDTRASERMVLLK